MKIEVVIKNVDGFALMQAIFLAQEEKMKNEEKKDVKEKMKTKTVIFEKKYDVKINDVSTTNEIDEIVEKKIGRKLKVVKINNHGI